MIKYENPTCAVVRSDVVGHSLGGIVSRSMPISTKNKYFKNNNYKKGLIHKLITIDTPHLGSGYADGLINLFVLSQNSNWAMVRFKALEKLLNAWGVDNSDPITGGAMFDLITTSAFLQLINDTNSIKLEPPLHTIVGMASFEQVTANEVYVFYLTDFWDWA